MIASITKKIGVYFLFILVVLAFNNECFAQNITRETELMFENFSIDDGLSQSSLTCVLQDSKGFLWIGSGDGLNRYDGRKFKVFYGNKNDSTALSNSTIWRVFEDSQHYVWVATGNGLNRFDWKTETFKQFYHNKKDSNSISDNAVWDIVEDNEGNLWFATGNGICKYNSFEDKFERFFYSANPNEKKIRFVSVCYDRNGYLYAGTYKGVYRLNLSTFEYDHFYIDKNDTVSSRSNIVFRIAVDSSGGLWFGTANGLFEMVADNKFLHFPLSDNKDEKVNVFAIEFSPDNKIWLGTYGSGLIYFEPNTHEYFQWKHNAYRKHSLIFDFIYDLAFDRSGILWIATNFGLSKLDLQKGRFRNFLYYPDCKKCLSDNIVWAIYEDSRGDLWFGTDRGGLTLYKPKQNKFFHFKHDPQNKSSLNENSVISIAEDHEGKIWIGTYKGGVNVLDPETYRFTHYTHKKDDPHSISSNFVQCIYVDKKGRIWLGTREGELNYFDRKTKRFSHYKLSGDSEYLGFRNQIWTICEDEQGNLLIGTETKGLIQFNPETRDIVHLSLRDPLKQTGIMSIMSIYADRKGILWMGTGGYGLIKYDVAQQKVRVYSKKDGLPNEVIYGILPQNDKRTGDLIALWLSTDKGLVRLQTSNDSVRVYTKGDGLPADEFDSGAYFKGKDGAMYFGTINGALQFFPDQIDNYDESPPVILTNLLLFNEPVIVGDDENAILKRSITETKEIELDYDQTVFTIEFAMLSFRNPEQQRYQYQMVGLDDDWIDLGQKREVTFTHIPPGEYEFRVRGYNNDGALSKKVASVKIRIIPPFYRKAWFKLLLIILVLLGAFVFHKYRTGLVKRRNKQLEKFNKLLNREIEDRRKAQTEIAASLREKEILLKEIHHRVKNNLQVTSSLLYLQSKNIKDKKARAYLEEAQTRIKSMAMIHEKLYQSETFTKINSRDYIRDLANYVFRSYSENAKKIRLNLYIEPVNFDLDSAIPCGLILNELLSNSIKYAFAGRKEGEITVSLRELDDDNRVELCVRDNGIGFPKNFDFNNTDSLGLQLVKSLTDQLEGTLSWKNSNGAEVKITFSKPKMKMS